MNYKITLLTSIIGLSGVLIGGLISISTNWIREYFEDQRSKRELIIKSAIEDWSKGYKTAQEHGGSIMPLGNYIIHYTLIFEAVLSQNFSVEKLKEALKKSGEITKIFYNNSKKTGHDLKNSDGKKEEGN